jgi:hypothetical protein
MSEAWKLAFTQVRVSAAAKDKREVILSNQIGPRRRLRLDVVEYHLRPRSARYSPIVSMKRTPKIPETGLCSMCINTFTNGIAGRYGRNLDDLQPRLNLAWLSSCWRFRQRTSSMLRPLDLAMKKRRLNLSTSPCSEWVSGIRMRIRLVSVERAEATTGSTHDKSDSAMRKVMPWLKKT